MRMLKGNGRPSGAFTLIEMILVMTILTVAVALAAPSLSRFFRGRNLDSEARRFLTIMRYGQERAVSEGLPMDLWIDSNRGQFGLRADESYEETDAKKIEFTLDETVRLETVTTNVLSRSALLATATTSKRNTQTANSSLPTFRFLPDGTVAETSPDSVRLTDNDGFTITIVRTRNRLGYEIPIEQPR